MSGNRLLAAALVASSLAAAAASPSRAFAQSADASALIREGVDPGQIFLTGNILSAADRIASIADGYLHGRVRLGAPEVSIVVPAYNEAQNLPELAARLKPASWTNGATFPCYNYTYALEYPDAPYAPGYQRCGSPSP